MLKVILGFCTLALTIPVSAADLDSLPCVRKTMAPAARKKLEVLGRSYVLNPTVSNYIDGKEMPDLVDAAKRCQHQHHWTYLERSAAALSTWVDFANSALLDAMRTAGVNSDAVGRIWAELPPAERDAIISGQAGATAPFAVRLRRANALPDQASNWRLIGVMISLAKDDARNRGIFTGLICRNSLAGEDC